MDTWDVYWLLKLDDIREMLNALVFAFTMLSVAGGLAGGVAMSVLSDEWGNFKKRHLTALLPALFLALIAFVCGVSKSLTPSTKQAAAIYMIPSLTTDENIDTIKSEAGDVYGLFKQWLNDQVHGDGESAPESE